MHFKRNLWLSMVGAIIIIAAVFFNSKNSEANSDEQKNLPQINQLNPHKQPEVSKELDAQSSYFKH
jgi:hypothetical protein